MSTRSPLCLLDGLSTVMALLACQAYFAGEPQPEAECPKNIAFTAGPQVKVIKYEDDDDREVRECWNIARHDQESFTVRWSWLHQKIAAAMAYFRRHGDWVRTASAMTDFYGEGKKATVGRWVRAAKGLHPETAAALKNHPEMKGAYLWDNSYLVPSSSRARDRLAPKFALIALELLSQHSEELSASAFVEKVCKPLRLLEVWHSLMCKRYGSVATMSPALGRLVARLASWSGLVTVRACMGTAVVLHDEQGIPECNLLAKELDKC
ncbi:MAG: hypothetical protein GY772_07750, partial [bacterium]|nr:hypothetical protein [bacterium]